MHDLSTDNYGLLLSACRCHKQRDVAKEHMKFHAAVAHTASKESRIDWLFTKTRDSLAKAVPGAPPAWLTACAQLFACAPEYYRKASDREDIKASFRLIGATHPIDRLTNKQQMEGMQGIVLEDRNITIPIHRSPPQLRCGRKQRRGGPGNKRRCPS